MKVENGWEKHSFSQIKSLLNDEQKPPSQRRRSHTIQDSPSSSNPVIPQTVEKQLTYESFWASHSQQRQHHHHRQQPQQLQPHPNYTNPGLRSSQPLFHHATF